MEGCLNLIVCETTVLDECYAANLAWKEQANMNVIWNFSFDADLAGHLLWNRYRQAHHPIRTSNEASGKLHGAEKNTLSWSNSGIRICYMYVYRMDMIDNLILNMFWDFWCILKVFTPARPRNVAQVMRHTKAKANKQPAHEITYNCLKPDLLWFLSSLSLQFPICVFSLEISFTNKTHPFTVHLFAATSVMSSWGIRNERVFGKNPPEAMKWSDRGINWRGFSMIFLVRKRNRMDLNKVPSLGGSTIGACLTVFMQNNLKYLKIC